MKICMLTNTHSPHENRIFFKEARSLKKIGHDVYIVGVGEKAETRKINGIPLIYVGRGTAKVGKRFVSILPLFIEAVKTNADAYHCHDLEALLLSVMLKILFRKKIVYDVHEAWWSIISQNPAIPSLFQPLLGRLIYTVETTLCKFVDHVITINVTLAEHFREIGKNTFIIYNVPPLSLFNPGRIAQKLEKEYRNYQVIIHEGTLTMRRGLKTILYSLPMIKKEIKNIKFVQLGKIRESKKTMMWMENYLKRNNLTTNFEHTPRLPYSEVAKFINVAKIGLKLSQFSSYNELISLPNKLFEYAACEKPVITTYSVEIKRIWDKSEFGIILRTANPKELAEAIIRLLRNSEEQKRMGTNGRKLVEEVYNWKSMEKILAEIYTKFVPAAS